MQSSHRIRIALLTAISMLCFAANSMLCRLALAPHNIDAASFVTIRVASAAAVLAAIMIVSGAGVPRLSLRHWQPAAALLGYLLSFAYGYQRVATGSGALLLFGAVQMTMFAVALWRGERLPAISWAALAVAVAGLVYLVLPGVGIAAPDHLGALLLIVSGVSWGIFTLLARSYSNALEANAVNFLACLPFVALANLISASDFKVSTIGVVYGVISGAIASGLGYLIWYTALRGLTRTQASTVQLVVPAIAALGGAVLLSEPVTMRLVISSVAVLGGVAVVLTQQHKPALDVTEETAG